MGHIYENYDFLKKHLNISFRTGQLFLCDNSFGKKVTEKTLWEYDLYKERSSIPYINLLMYVNVIFAKNMFKNHVDPICDALAQKVLIAHKLVSS